MQSAMQPVLGTQHQVMQAVRSVSQCPMLGDLLQLPLKSAKCWGHLQRVQGSFLLGRTCFHM